MNVMTTISGCGYHADRKEDAVWQIFGNSYTERDG